MRTKRTPAKALILFIAIITAALFVPGMVRADYTPTDRRPYVQFVDKNGYDMQSDQGGFYEFVNVNTLPQTLNYKCIIHTKPNYSYNGFKFTCYDLKLEIQYLNTNNPSDTFLFFKVKDGYGVNVPVNTAKMSRYPRAYARGPYSFNGF